MTDNERAIAVFKNKLEWEKEKRYPFISKEEVEAYKMAIQALEQEPMRDATPEERESVNAYIKSISKPTGIEFDKELCDDAVSRQAFDEIKELMTDINGDTVYAVRMSDIRQLPPVNPQEKNGQIDKQTLWNKAGTSNHITRADVNVRPPKDNSGTQALNEGYL